MQLAQTLLPNRRIEWHSSIDSTMHQAVQLAAEGAPSGTVVGADEQTAGQGRFNRVWHSERGAGLYFSIILRLPIETAAMPAVTLALGCAVVEALQITANVAPDLRWPNDVLLNDKKVCGILTQLHGQAIVSGIGINVNQTSFPSEIQEIATSVRIATSREHSREQLFVALLDDIDRYCDILVQQGRSAIFDLYSHHSSYVSGRRVIVDEEITGTTAGLTPEGFLRLRKDDGTDHTVLAGGLRPCS